MNLLPQRIRVSPRVPKELRDFIHAIADRHIPRASHVNFFIYLLKNGMDTVEKGQPKLGAKWVKKKWKGDDVRFQHHINIKYIERFNRIADRLEPKPRKRELLIHILNLGIQFYYEEHDEFGIRKD